MNTTVSVIIPAYNAERTIEATIQSCLNQTVPPLEVLVVDDGSSDRTAEVVAAFPPPVRFLRKTNGGPGSARNMGAREAKGDWLAMLDADDQWLPNKLERQLLHDVSPDIGMIHNLVESSKPGTPPEIGFEDLWDRNWICNSSVLIRRHVFEALGGFDEDRRLISVEDYNLWLRVAAAGWRIVTCAEYLVDYTRGVGISSHTEKFFIAGVNNIIMVSERLKLPVAKTNAKLAQVYTAFGDAALHQRNMPLARMAYKKAWAIDRSTRSVARLAASRLPPAALDIRRHFVDGLDRARDRFSPLPYGVVDSTAEAEATFSAKGPFLVVIVDTEEEFDWRVVPSPSTSVRAMAHQDKAQAIFDKFGIVPTYAVDYAIVSQRDGYGPLLDYLVDRRCEIGTHLHPWLNPPIREELTVRNSYPGNLPASLEFEKIRVLTETIQNNLGHTPILYRAGRYGLGPNTAHALKRLGYRIDCSVLPLFNLSHMGGPDFRRCRTKPYWTDPQRDLLELPVTVGVVGALSAFGRRLHPMISNPSAESFRVPGFFAQLNLINRVRLTPEGVPLGEAKQLTRTLMKEDDHQVFVMSYHSPSLMPGNTPYVRDEDDLVRFLRWLEAYVEYFVSELGGSVTTPKSLLAMAGAVESVPLGVPQALFEARRVGT